MGTDASYAATAAIVRRILDHELGGVRDDAVARAEAIRLRRGADGQAAADRR